MAKKENFKSFWEVSDYLFEASSTLDKVRRKALVAWGTLLRDSVRWMHWKRQEWRPVGWNETPLLKTGKLRNSVNVKFSEDSAVVFTDMERLATIHEYWITYRMTDKQRKFLFAFVFTEKWQSYVKAKNPWYITIPARPLRRTALDKFSNQVFAAMEKEFESLFS